MLIIDRTFDAPRGLVFEMWTNPKHVRRWFGPTGTTMRACEMDVRPGGALRFYYRLPSGEEVWVSGVFRDVQEPERLSFNESFTDASGNLIERPGYPLTTFITVTFEEREGRTVVTVEHAGIDESQRQAWSDTLDHLTQHIDHYREEQNQ